MNIWRIIIVIIAAVIICGLIQVLIRNKKDMTWKEAFGVGAYAGLGCILPLLFNIFIFFVTIGILYIILSYIFG